MGYWGGYAPYVTVAEKQAKAARKLAQLKKKNPNISPVVITGRTIAHTWWGKSWNVNLERYADYSNRIGRGRSYVRHGTVLDLQINPGKVTALVQGTASRPYSVAITIGEINKETWENIKEECQGKFDALPELMEGKFPKALREIFTAKGKGLFPSPKEIKFSCSCPDSAYMCKHVAAALYGIGARLDQDPMLFFTLRKADVNDLISEALAEKTEKLLKKSKKKSTRVLADADVGDMFGIEMDDAPVQGKKDKAVSKPVKKETDKKSKPSKVKPEKVKPKKVKTAPGKKTAPKKTSKSASAKTTKTKSPAELVEESVMRSRTNIDVPTLEKRTGVDSRIIFNTIYKMLRQGKVVRVARGLYKKKT